MTPLLSPRGLADLAAWLDGETLVAFDYDGTLTAIVDDPAEAVLPSTTRGLLRELAAVAPLALVTGRARVDAARRVSGVAFREIVGNHGAEPEGLCPVADSDRARRAVRAAVDALVAVCSSFPGAEVEDKGWSVSGHYRRAADRAGASRAFWEAAAALGSTHRVIHGKQVVDVVPHGGPSKGAAVASLAARYGCQRVIFFGDDVTDEDVFNSLPPSVLLGVRVGGGQDSAASHIVEQQVEMDVVLEHMLTLRRARRV